MPEGPEIRRTADRLHRVLAGQTIESLEVTLPALQSARQHIEGQTVEQVTCHGKALLTRLSTGYTLYSHNQLYGIWRISRRGHVPDTRRALRVALHTHQHSARLYSATDIALWKTDDLHTHPFLSKLGPDVLDPALTPPLLAARLADKAFRNRQLGNLYLDQGFLAGIGNYLRAEILFAARLSPQRRPADLTEQDLNRLARASIRISRRSYSTGGVTNPPARVSKLRARQSRGFESYRFAIFARAGKRCYECGKKIEKGQMTSRRIYWCPGCQPQN